MPAPENTLKRRLLAGEMLNGCWLAFAEAAVAEVAATAGFDWLLIDGEHAPNDLRSISAQLAVLAGANPVVRVRDHDPAAIKQVLDAGAQSLLVPMVESAAQAEALVRAVRYPPRGIRGVGASAARASGFGAIPDYLGTADAQICLIVQVESRAGLAALDGILGVEGVDGVFIGPSDLSSDMGHPGRIDAPEVMAAIEDALRRIRASGKAAGVFATRPDFAARCRAAGATFVAVGVDLSLYIAALRQLSADAGAASGR